MKIFVCSPLRGPDGQPSAENISLAKKLMRAVFDAGHAPFVPHLLYPQVLTESPADLRVAFKANFAFLYACDEIWAYARDLAGCSGGMRLEIEDVYKSAEAIPHGSWPRVVFMPQPFEKVMIETSAAKAALEKRACLNCGVLTVVGPSGRCFDCFSGVSHR